MPTSRAKRTSEQASALKLATKLVGFAHAQLDALRRDASGQFDWLVLRRDGVTSELQSLMAAGVRLEGDDARRVDALRQELQEADVAMVEHVQQRMRDVAAARSALGKQRKVMGPYLMAGSRAPSFVDRRG